MDRLGRGRPKSRPTATSAARPHGGKGGSGGSAYSAWWEVIPGPSIDISMTIQPGDHMHASVAETVPNSNVWVITLQDVTRNETFSQTVPYSSSHATAEWIEETPLILGRTRASPPSRT